VRGLAKAQARLPGMRVEVFGSRDAFWEADLKQWTPLAVHTAPVVGPARLCYTPALRGMIEVFGPDLIHSAAVWTWQAAVVNQVHARQGTPYVLSTRGTLDPWALRQSRLKKAIARCLFQQRHFDDAACLHALNEAEAQSLRAYGLKNPIAIVPNGIHLPEQSREQKVESRNAGEHAETLKAEMLKGDRQDAERRKVESRNEFQLSAFPISAFPEGRKVLLYLGRIHPKKGLVNLLRAWSETLKHRSTEAQSWCLAIAGWDEGGHEAELKQLATESGLKWADLRELKTESRNQKAETISAFSFQDVSVLFLGPLFGRDKEAAYANCDAFILPSYSEGLPMAVLEAWSYAKPVLMTPECNLPEGFDAGSAIRIQQEAEMLKAETLKGGGSMEVGLRELFEAPGSALQAMGARGRALVETRFAWPQIAREMKSVYDWVLGGGGKPGCVVLKS
jgi:poly(glycerol-phosphate) alpha-glucosyltransferase